MSNCIPKTKHSETFTQDTKNTTTINKFLRHGKEPTTNEILDYTLQSVIFRNGTVLSDVSVADLMDAVFTNLTKH